MKPVLIYGMPRTRSTAAMQACKRTMKLNEPFSFHNTPDYNENAMGCLTRIRTLTNYEQSEHWSQLLDKMNHPDAVVKIFGTHLARYYSAREWFDEANTSHEIFTLIRNPRETVFSILLAKQFGHWKGVEKDVKEITIHDSQFCNVEFVFESFLRFYPKSSRLVTFETLPEDFFDKSQIYHEQQHSMSRINLIQNLDRVEKNIDTILQYFEKQWKDVTGMNIHAASPC